MTQNLLDSQAISPGHSQPTGCDVAQIMEGEVRNARSLQREEAAAERFLERAGADDAEVLTRQEHV